MIKRITAALFATLLTLLPVSASIVAQDIGRSGLAVRTDLSTKSRTVSWTDKRVLWLGTSIPHQGVGTDSYPELFCATLGCSTTNMAWSGSFARFTPAADPNSSLSVRGLSMTEDDRVVLAALFPGSAWDDADPVTKASQMTADYRIFDPFIAGAIDTVFLDHAHNDRLSASGILNPTPLPIVSITKGATTTVQLAPGNSVSIGDAVALSITGIDKLNNAAARVQSVAGTSFTLNIDSSGFAGSFTSGNAIPYDRTTIRGAFQFLIHYIKWAAVVNDRPIPKIVLSGAPSEYTNAVFDPTIRLIATYLKEISQKWDLEFFDIGYRFRIDSVTDQTVYFEDNVHPISRETRQALTNQWVLWAQADASRVYNPNNFLPRATGTFLNQREAIYLDSVGGFKTPEFLLAPPITSLDEDFSGGLGGYTTVGTPPTIVAAPWNASEFALRSFSTSGALTSYATRSVLGDQGISLEFDLELPQVSGLTAINPATATIVQWVSSGSYYLVRLLIRPTSTALQVLYFQEPNVGLVTVPIETFLLDANTKYRLKLEATRATATQPGGIKFYVDDVAIAGPVETIDDGQTNPANLWLGISGINTGADLIVYIGNVLAKRMASLDYTQRYSGTIGGGEGETVTVVNGVVTETVPGSQVASTMTCRTQNGSATVDLCNSTTGLKVGDFVQGPGIVDGTKVLSGITASSFVMDAPAGAGAAGSGAISSRGAYWANLDSALPSIIRHRGRMMLGDAVGTSDDYGGTQYSFCATNACAQWIQGDAHLGVMHPRGGTAIMGYTKGSLGGAVSLSTIGVAGLALGDRLNKAAWSFYGDLIYKEGGALGLGLELAIKNVSTTNATSTPYGGQLAAPRGLRVFGGDNSYGGTATNPIDNAFELIKGGSTFNTGLLFYKDSLTGADGITGFGTAIRMARRHTLRWDVSTGASGLAIYSDVATAGKDMSFFASDDSFSMNSAGGITARFLHIPGTVAARLAMQDALTGNAPQLLAEGSDTNIDIKLVPRGTGSVIADGPFVAIDKPETTDGLGTPDVTPEMYGAVGNGVADDTAAVQACGNAGRGWCTGRGLSTYKVTQSITCPQNTAGAKPVGYVGLRIYAPAANFNNTSLAAGNRYGTNAVVINCSGLTTGPFTPNYNVVLRDNKIQSEVSQGRNIRGIVVQNVVNPIIENNELYGFPIGVGIAGASLIGGSITDNYIHDFTDNAVWASAPQVTGIEIDQDLINSVPSDGTVIRVNRIHNITVGSTIISSWGFQADGINLTKTAGLRLLTNDNNIYNTGDGIDVFSANGSIANNIVDKAYNYCYKFVHGASNNNIIGNIGRNCGIGGLGLFGGSVAAVTGNLIAGNHISTIDPDGTFVGSTTASLLITDNGGPNLVSNNRIQGNVFDPGANGKYAYRDSGTGTGNVARDNKTVAGVSGTFSVTAGSTTYETATLQASPADPTGTTSAARVMMGLTGSITLPTGTSGKLQCSLSGTARNATGGNAVSVSMRYGQGSAPVNGAALAGTADIGVSQSLFPSGNSERVGFSIPGIITGLSAGTYWIDAALASASGTTATIANVGITCFEIR